MSIERLTAEVQALNQIVNGLVNGQSSGYSDSGVQSRKAIDELENQVADLKTELRVLKAETVEVQRRASAQASQSAKSAMLGALESAATPIIQMVVDSEKANEKQIRAGIAGVSSDITAAKSIAGQSATTSRDLLLATVNQFSRG
jgi:molecular chaperone GrpE (heat shock protein)